MYWFIKNASSDKTILKINNNWFFLRGLECLDNDKKDYFSLLVILLGMNLLDIMTEMN